MRVEGASPYPSSSSMPVRVAAAWCPGQRRPMVRSGEGDVKYNGSGSRWVSVTLTMRLEEETGGDSVQGQEDSRYRACPRGLRRSGLRASVRAVKGNALVSSAVRPSSWDGKT